MLIIIWLLITAAVGFYATVWSIFLAKKYDVLDHPASRPDSKKHKLPIPLMGGLGFCIGCIALGTILYEVKSYIPHASANLELFNWYGILLGFIVIVVGGMIDDVKTLSSKQLLPWVVIGVAVAVWAGDIGIDAFSYPLGNIIPDNIFIQRGLAFIWVLVCVAATKFMDGADGLVGTVGIIAFLSIASVAQLPFVAQPFVGLFACTCAMLLFIFLGWNFPNAKAYLGEAGSEAVGFWIGVLSLISGAKVATASSVIGLFIVDIIFVFTIRYLQGVHIFKADRQHWHHRLIDIGVSKEKLLIITALILLVATHIALSIPTQWKIIIIIAQFITIAASVISFSVYKKKLN
jgi:UDP-GlcNAc:undecaprenyl-phosphate/decaprenyl-phosphate GlcNAc-1-phosphate transferase